MLVTVDGDFVWGEMGFLNTEVTECTERNGNREDVEKRSGRCGDSSGADYSPDFFAPGRRLLRNLIWPS